MKSLSLTLLALTCSFNLFAAELTVVAHGSKLIITSTSSRKYTAFSQACSKSKSEAETAIKEECFLKGYVSCNQLSIDTTIKRGYGLDETKYCEARVKYTAEM